MSEQPEMADPPVVYLVVRQSPDCHSRMVEIMGACMTLADADALREYIFKRKGVRCHVEWLHPEPPSKGVDHGK
jgi:hypothetical protein